MTVNHASMTAIGNTSSQSGQVLMAGMTATETTVNVNYPVSGAAITWTSDGTPVCVRAFISGSDSCNSNHANVFGYLYDAGYPTGQSSTVGLCGIMSYGGSTGGACSFEDCFVPAAGSHTIQLIASERSDSSCTWTMGNVYGAAATNPVFRVVPNR